MNITKACKHGTFLYNQNDLWVGKSLTHYGEYSEGEVDLFKAVLKPGDFVIEVGANFGSLTIPLANIVGPSGAVVAYEPQRLIFNLLSANIAINNIKHIYAFQEAVGSVNGKLDIPELNYSREGNFGGLELFHPVPENVQSYRVRIVRLDDLGFKRLDFLKADVEGMEVDVLNGALKTIEEFKPLLYLENDRVSKVQELFDLLKSMGYRIYKHTPALYNPKNFLANQDNVLGSVVSYNLLCCHETKSLPEGLNLRELIESEPLPLKVPRKTDEIESDLTKNLVVYAATSYKKEFKFPQAHRAFQFALNLKPDNWTIHYEYARMLLIDQCYELALEHNTKALDLYNEPSPPVLLWNLQAIINNCLLRLDEAIAWSNRILEIDPENTDIKYNLGYYGMMRGDLEGFEGYENRFDLPRIQNRLKQYSKTMCRNLHSIEALNEKTVFVICEQGHGDIIHFMRYLGLLRPMCKRLIVEIPDNLEKLFKELFSIKDIEYFVRKTYNEFKFETQGTIEPPEYDVLLSLTSLPFIFKDKLWDAPKQYIESKPWEEVNRVYVGLVWAGGKDSPHDNIRSLTKKNFKIFENIPGIKLNSFQKDCSDRNWINKGVVNLSEGEIDAADLSPELTSFAETANLLNAIDVLVTVDTSVAHLAGAMGKKVFLLIPFQYDWRWGTWACDGIMSRWYPDVRIFRQEKNGEWGPVLEKIKKELEILAHGKPKIQS